MIETEIQIEWFPFLLEFLTLKDNCILHINCYHHDDGSETSNIWFSNRMRYVNRNKLHFHFKNQQYDDFEWFGFQISFELHCSFLRAHQWLWCVLGMMHRKVEFQFSMFYMANVRIWFLSNDHSCGFGLYIIIIDSLIAITMINWIWKCLNWCMKINTLSQLQSKNSNSINCLPVIMNEMVLDSNFDGVAIRLKNMRCEFQYSINSTFPLLLWMWTGID